MWISIAAIQDATLNVGGLLPQADGRIVAAGDKRMHAAALEMLKGLMC